MDNNKQQQNNTAPTPVFMTTEEVTPPMTPDLENTSPATTTPTTSSTAPTNDVVTPTVTPDNKNDSKNTKPISVDGMVKKKNTGGKGKIVATILGIMLLVGSIGAGIILVKQQQDVRERAGFDSTGGLDGPTDNTAGGGYNNNNDGGGGGGDGGGGVTTIYCTTCSGTSCVPTNTPGCNATDCFNDGDCGGTYDPNPPDFGNNVFCNVCNSQGDCVSSGQSPCQIEGCTSDADCSDVTPGAGGSLQEGEQCLVTESPPDVFIDNCGPGLTCHCQSGDNCPESEAKCESTSTISKELCEIQGRTWTINHMGYGMTCCVPGYVDNPDGKGCVPGETSGGGGNGGGTPPPTTPTTVSATCYDIKAYDENWAQLTATQLSQLTNGDVVRFTVVGQASSGVFTKARFTINGTLRPEVITKKTGTEEYYDEYIIPAGVTTFSISAEVYHDSLGWK